MKKLKLYFFSLSYFLLLFGCAGSDSSFDTSASSAEATKSATTDTTDAYSGGEAVEIIADESDEANSDGKNSVELGTLTAGDIDDNLNFKAFVEHINSVLQLDTVELYPSLAFNDRVTFQVVDENDVRVSNARIQIEDGDANILYQAQFNSEGTFYFFPANDGVTDTMQLTVSVTPPSSSTPAATTTVVLSDLDETRTVNIVLDGYSNILPKALDLMLVLDTTGSMSDELEYLITEFESIIETVQQQFAQTEMRFGLTVYRDEGDDYVVRGYDFTESLTAMQQQLSIQRADGGGNYPEAMDRGLEEALSYQWSGSATAKMLFLIADAPPHDDQLEATFAHVQTAREKGIQIYPIAASGVLDLAENLMRSMAVLTHGRHLFLTDDSGVGNSHKEPDIPCYVATALNDLMTRIIASVLNGARVEAEENDIIRESGNYENGVCEQTNSDDSQDN